MKTCCKCGEEKFFFEFHRQAHSSDGRQSWCKPCLAAYKLVWNKTKRGLNGNRASRVKYNQDNPAVLKANVVVKTSIRRGDLARQPCEVCGSERVHAHHPDYLNPLDVMWLCPTHHKQWHIKHGPGLNM